MVWRVATVLFLLTTISECYCQSLQHRSFNKRYLAAQDSMTDIPSSKRAQLRDHWLAPDKAKHLMGSLISTVFFHQVASHGFQSSQSEAALAAAGISFALGAGKECMDRRKEGNFFSWKDLVADVAGLLTGLVIANQP